MERKQSESKVLGHLYATLIKKGTCHYQILQNVWEELFCRENAHYTLLLKHYTFTLWISVAGDS